MKTTEKLLDAAEYRMRRGGYNAVSFRDLAADTNIKSSSVHYHYPRKEDLGTALIERYSTRFFQTLAEHSRNAKTSSSRLKAFQKVYSLALTSDDAVCLCGLLGAELAGLPEELAHGVQAFFRSNVAWVAEALPDSFAPEERQTTASTIVAAHQGALVLASSLNDKKLFASITDQVIGLAFERRQSAR